MNTAAENIEVVVVDEERRDQALEIVDSMVDRGKDHYKALDNMREQLADLVENHDVSVAELDAFWGEYFELDAQFSKDIIEARFSLKDSLSREEWTAIFSSASADTNKP
jgi:hypothetical protein